MYERDESMAMAATTKALADTVFPPINHENLHIIPPSSLSPQSSSSISNFFSSSSYSSSSSSSFSPSDADEEERDEPRGSEPPLDVAEPGRSGPGLLRIGLGLLRSKVLEKVRFFVGSGKGGGGRVVWSIGALAVAVTWVWWLYVRIRFRRRWMMLVQGIQERDEKIAQLLHQIAQMNEVLLRKHRDLTSKLPN